MPHQQSENFIGFLEAAKLAGIRHLASEDLSVVFARHHGFRSRDQGSEEPIELFNVHRPAALASSEELRETIEFGVGQWLVLGEGFHKHLRFSLCPSCPSDSLAALNTAAGDGRYGRRLRWGTGFLSRPIAGLERH